MLYRKDGYPEEDELVLCSVTKIHHHSVFCTLDEYDNKSGMIHISEISPGRIRNIRNYVQEGKKVVCKILKLDLEKGHIDLSLRRVNEAQKKAKLSLIKQEQKAEKIIEGFANQLKKPIEEIYGEISKTLFEKYEMIFMAFEDVVENDIHLKDLGLNKELADPLEKIVKEKIKPAQVTITGDLEVTSYDSDGVEVVKKALQEAEKKGADVSYTGAGKYRVSVTAHDYKAAEKILAESMKASEDLMEKNQGNFKFERH